MNDNRNSAEYIPPEGVQMAKYDWGKFGLHIPDILVPRAGTDYYKWAVVACDQYTSEPDYWDEAERIVGDAPSTLRLMLPEIYLGKADEGERISNIRKTMQDYLAGGMLTKLAPGCVLVKRASEGHERLGLVIATDLEQYDYSAGSTSLIRATEGTVVERIPPRLRIREGAPVEMPHIIILIDDPGKTVIEPLADAPCELLYDTDLMMDGGHISGSFIAEKDMEQAKEALCALYDAALEKYGDGNLILQAVGDGNHSLATAKANWENIKKTLSPEEAETHPARYALCEIENIHDDGIIFEPINRVLFPLGGQSGAGLVDELTGILDSQNGSARKEQAGPGTPVSALKPERTSDGAYRIPYFTASEKGYLVIEDPSFKLEVGTLQNAIDVMVKERGSADVDYIHGTDSTVNLASAGGNAGFILPAMDKSLLFPAVATDGALPRKTFSMGEANEKRYYIESRYIVK
jgi:hypothetical protein